ncbi:MAG: O-acetyl-ADP-ribose deacetylase [Elusimicrobiota bacterium]
MIQTLINKTKLTLIKGDITQQETAAIVNAANSSLMGGGGVDGAIHRAGGPKILEECIKIIQEIGRLSAGKAVITSGGNLKARYVIHTVGPVWKGGREEEDRVLASAYDSCLELARENSISSISFPSISTGAYNYPVGNAAKIAVSTVVDFVRKNGALKEVRFVLFSPDDLETYTNILRNLYP